jgi:hypothetical protein
VTRSYLPRSGTAIPVNVSNGTKASDLVSSDSTEVMEVERRWLVEVGVDALEDDGDAEGVYWEPSADCQL